MPVPALATSSVRPEEAETDVLVLGLTGGGTPALALPDGADAVALGLEDVDLVALGASGAAGELLRLPARGVAAGSIALVGLGAGDADALRIAAASAVRRLAGTPSVALALPAAEPALVAAVLEGAALGSYAYTEHRGKTLEQQKAPVAGITVLGADDPDAVRRATVLAESVALVKDLVNAPPNALSPAALADAALAAVEGLEVETRVWDERALQDGGFGGILGVGAGSVRPPRLVRIGWAPEGAPATVALVGKGITFDSGGLSLKPPASMVGMKTDMAGAATVLAVVRAAAALRLPVGVTAWLCIAENLPSGSALRPNDVLTIRGGRTVEVLNTDAEGRLVLADGLVAASEEGPDAIVDVATLTGAIIVSLGNRYVGAMGDGALVARTQAAAQRAGELVWHLPLPEELRRVLDSDVADLANVKIGSTAGGALVAGQFLKEFVGDGPDGERIPWVHLDIAGAANNGGSPWGVTGAGPTGVMVRTLVELVRDLAEGSVDAV
ncbi:leucyl aminopeptidase [Amnibacterium sp. CER49]|uniref:leucyl aminopeptidase n=1 Tax=Amnibacterium sp. CER49 TaxID=3039161 RepID=UPI00244AF917|nr:leucyl aminopeptidase [Amnibacterium sp. CER49]MDH2442337.1 leucyl aminopeptidase [Amnibacterium sp. CER49]